MGSLPKPVAAVSACCGSRVGWEGNGLAGVLLEVGDDDGFKKFELQQQYFLRVSRGFFYLK
jgi:hypothetical protein